MTCVPRVRVEFLKAENEMLRKRVPKKRIFLKPDERNRLLKLGREIGPGIRSIISIVDYSTFRRWIMQQDGIQPKVRKGRPRIATILRKLVVQIAKETGWGYSRILGELRKLNLGKNSRQSVKNILVDHGLDPGPRLGKGSWSDFLKIHADTLWQIDFFSKMNWTPKGLRQVFAIAFIHAASRRVFVTTGTFSPSGDWMQQQAHAFLEHTSQQQLPCETLMCDWDSKYSKDFTTVFRERGIKVKRVGPRAPNLNAFVERWIQSLKHEALNNFIVFGLRHFDHPPPSRLNEIRCQTRLGGLLRPYYRAA